MTKDEALKMCLEYIETNAHERKYVRHAIKEALAQPEQETVAYQDTAEKCRLETVPANGTLFHTTPPQRTWVGLTDEEISELIRATHNTGSFVRAIEAKFKEKNT